MLVIETSRWAHINIKLLHFITNRVACREVIHLVVSVCPLTLGTGFGLPCDTLRGTNWAGMTEIYRTLVRDRSYSLFFKAYLMGY